MIVFIPKQRCRLPEVMNECEIREREQKKNAQSRRMFGFLEEGGQHVQYCSATGGTLKIPDLSLSLSGARTAVRIGTNTDSDNL